MLTRFLLVSTFVFCNVDMTFESDPADDPVNHPVPRHHSRCPSNCFYYFGCPYGFACDLSNRMCCQLPFQPSTTAPAATCGGEQIPTGLCFNGKCGDGLFCDNLRNLCCPMPAQACSNSATPIGTCINGFCAAGICSSTGFCCP